MSRRRDLARSPVGDMKAVLKCEGKFFPTTSTILPPREAPQLPHWIETAIDGSRFSLREQSRLNPLLFLTLSLSAYSEVSRYNKFIDLIMNVRV